MIEKSSRRFVSSSSHQTPFIDRNWSRINFLAVRILGPCAHTRHRLQSACSRHPPPAELLSIYWNGQMWWLGETWYSTRVLTAKLINKMNENKSLLWTEHQIKSMIHESAALSKEWVAWHEAAEVLLLSSTTGLFTMCHIVPCACLHVNQYKGSYQHDTIHWVASKNMSEHNEDNLSVYGRWVWADA